MFAVGMKRFSSFLDYPCTTRSSPCSVMRTVLYLQSSFSNPAVRCWKWTFWIRQQNSLSKCGRNPYQMFFRFKRLYGLLKKLQTLYTRPTNTVKAHLTVLNFSGCFLFACLLTPLTYCYCFWATRRAMLYVEKRFSFFMAFYIPPTGAKKQTK